MLQQDSVVHLQSEFVLHRPKRTLHGPMLRRVERCGVLRCSWWEYVTECKVQIVQGYELCSLLWTKTDYRSPCGECCKKSQETRPSHCRTYFVRNQQPCAAWQRFLCAL